MEGVGKRKRRRRWGEQEEDKEEEVNGLILAKFNPV